MDNKQSLRAYIKSRTINVTLPAGLLEEIDESAKRNYVSRSEFIRESVILRLRKQHIVNDEDIPSETF